MLCKSLTKHSSVLVIIFQISIKAVLPDNSTSFVGLTNITLRVGGKSIIILIMFIGIDPIIGDLFAVRHAAPGFKSEMVRVKRNSMPARFPQNITPRSPPVAGVPGENGSTIGRKLLINQLQANCDLDKPATDFTKR